MNLSAQEYLAKLLAKENLSVQHGNYQTASFDVINRVLRLPLWADKGKDVYDLLVGHEVGHALFTPADGWHDSDMKIGHIPKAYLNIVEDIRIERKIQESYPGIIRRFKAGYKRLFDDNLFGTNDRDINTAGLMDRLNVSAKGRGYVAVDFADDESPLIKEAMQVETWDDVIVICQKLYDFIEAKKEKEEEEKNPEYPIDTPSPEKSEDKSEQGNNPIEGNQEPSGEDPTGGADSISAGKYIPENTEHTIPEQVVVEDDTHETWTEDTFRDSEEELLQQAPKRFEDDIATQSKYSSGISKFNIDKMIYSYKEAAKMRTDYIEEGNCGQHSPYTSSQCKDDWNETKGTYKTQANLIAKDFERKKAAFEYQRATTAKSGKLDPLKMHSYKYSEDIFLTTTKLAQAKSHGIMMFVDLSGSMADIISDVVAQTITIAMFCRQVGIPFEAYTFTTTSYYRSLPKNWDENNVIEPSELENTNTKVVEMFSSKMNKKTFDEAAQTMFAIGKAHGMKRTAYHVTAYEIHAIDQMGSTPLIQTCYAASKLTKEFTRKHGIQNTNIMMLTDGCPDGISIAHDERANAATHGRNMAINFEGKMLEGTNARVMYVEFLLRLKELTGATVMGFHLASDASSFGQGYHGVNSTKEWTEVIKDWRKESFSSWKNAKGYDDYFIIKINKSARFDSEEFAPKKADTIGDLKREFKKFNKSKKGNKQLVARITDAVAA